MNRLDIKQKRDWTDWDKIENAVKNERGYYGVYKIGIINNSDKPINIKRMYGEDKQGIIYIGRARPRLSLARRIGQFARLVKMSIPTNHSGAETFYLSRLCLERYLDTRKYHLYYSVKRMCSNKQLNTKNKLDKQKQKIAKEETNVLAEYFEKFCELPPCNSYFGEKWEYFKQRIRVILENKKKGIFALSLKK